MSLQRKKSKDEKICLSRGRRVRRESKKNLKLKEKKPLNIPLEISNIF